jgi:hypothetical protein
MAKIKLFKVDVMDCGTVRLQSQLKVGTGTVDFIIDNDILKWWTYGEKGFSFYEFDKPYEIVENIEEMKTQKL